MTRKGNGGKPTLSAGVDTQRYRCTVLCDLPADAHRDVTSVGSVCVAGPRQSVQKQKRLDDLKSSTAS